MCCVCVCICVCGGEWALGRRKDSEEGKLTRIREQRSEESGSSGS